MNLTKFKRAAKGIATAPMSPCSPQYINPFEGRRKAIRLSGLFLFDPEVTLRIQGRSFRKIFTEMGEESLYKMLERAARLSRSTRSLENRLIGLLPDAMAKTFAAAFHATDTAMHAFSTMGPWESYLFGAMRDDDGKPTNWSASAQFICDIEHASRHAAVLCAEGQSQAAADYLSGHALLKNFMSPEMLYGISQTPNPDDQLVFRLIAALEVWLSVLAIWDIEAGAATCNNPSYIQQLLPREDSMARNSVAQLFDWLLKTAKVDTLTALIKDPRLHALDVQVGTLGAWSRGTNFPSTSYRTLIAKAVLSNEDAATFKILSAATRHLNFLGYVAQYLVKILETLDEARIGQARLMGLGLPFGHITIEEWMRQRYPLWLHFHRARLKGLKTASP